MPESVRRISWLKAARKKFRGFSSSSANRHRNRVNRGRAGRKADSAKPFKSVEGGVFEIAIRHRGDAFRAIYAVQIGEDIWVIDAFQKKSKSGIKTPRMDVDRIKERLKRLKEVLQ
jgi:phage-related protein